MADSGQPTVAARIVEAMREVGVLLIAFAPLDAMFCGGLRALRWMLLFFSFGVLLFIAALVLERTRFDGP